MTSYSESARGVVIESKIDKGKGPVSTILINNGKLNKGDFFNAVILGVNGAMITTRKDSE